MNQKRYGWLISLVVLLAVVIPCVRYLEACGTQPQKHVVVDVPPDPTPAPPPPPAQVCDGTHVGDTKKDDCPAGQAGLKVEVCTASGWTIQTNTCAPQTSTAPCGKTQFADVQPVLQQYCVGCHAAWGSYNGIAKTEPAKMSTRIALPVADQQHMPQHGAPHGELCNPLQTGATGGGDPAQPTSCDKVTLLQKWVSDGAIDACPTTGGNPPTPTTQFITQDVEVSAMVADAENIPQANRHDIRYLSVADIMNMGATPAQVQTFVDAIQKGLNSLAPSTQTLVKATKVDQAAAVWRFDFTDFGMNSAELKAVEAADVNLPIIDNTSKGVVLQQLLGTKQPYFRASNFLDIAFRNSSVYYKFLNIPTTLARYQQQIGVNLANDLATLPAGQITFVGNIGQITLNKNRLIIRDQEARTPDGSGWYYQTNDVNANPNIEIVNNQVVDSKNLTQAPLLAGVGAQLQGGASVANFTQDASETIARLPNGLQAYGLWDANGNRLDAADPNVVQDNQVQIGNRVITAGNTCSRCHNDGMNPMADEIRQSVLSSNTFLANDVNLVKGVYRTNDVVTAMFAKDNAAFRATLAQLGIKPGADPQAQVSDFLLGNWTLKQIGAYVGLTVDQITACINGSAATKSALGTVLTPGGTVPFTTLAGTTFKQMVTDCNLFQDPVAQ